MKIIDTDKYEPTQIDWMLHNTREHSPDGWRKLSKSLIELSDDDRLLIEYAPTLRAEVKRLREGIEKQIQFTLECVGSDIGDLYETIADDLRRLIE